MTQRTYDYGILGQNALVKDLEQKPQSQRTVLLGTIVKIEGVLGNRTFAVRFLKEDGETWESGKFCCEQGIVVSVNEGFWPLLAAVSSPQERVKLSKNPIRCEHLMKIVPDNVVGFLDFGEVLLGTVKFIGNIKGMGKGFGIFLHEKKINNRCNGTCAGIRYFDCPPGYGVFTTVERIVIQNTPSITAKVQTKLPAIDVLDEFTQRNLARISIKSNNECELHKKDSVYKNDMYIPTTKANVECTEKIHNRLSNNFKTSVSLQNILEQSNNLSLNTNNDFDQNTIIQPDDTYLVHESRKGINMVENNKHKSEMDLIEAIGGSWPGSTDSNHVLSYANLKQSLDKSPKKDHAAVNDKPLQTSLNHVTLKSSRNKSVNPVSHLVNGSKTVPRRSKLLQENVLKECNLNPTMEMNVEKINRNSTESRSTTHTVHYEPPAVGTTNDLTVGMLIEILNDVSNEPLYGVIRWMGVEPSTKQVLVGVELEEEQTHLPLTLTDGIHNGQRLFKCAENRGIFVPLKQCHKDSRFADGPPTPAARIPDKMFGKEVDCPIVKGSVPPLCMPTEEDVEAVCGKFRGIQGHHNSCYLDATLFAMFTFTAVFDSLLFRPKGANDIPYYEEVQQVLKEEIVNPLRTNLFVRADRVMSLRKLLDQLSSVSGLTSEEKDPEEFLHSLLAQILKAEPFLKLSSGHEAYHYQLFVEKDDGLTLPTVQQLFEQSFLTSDIKLKEVPSCLIIQMPRFGKSYKMYPRILPSQLLDVTDVIENSPRQCTICGKLAKWECKQCFGECGVGLESTAFCNVCIEKAHSHSRRALHNPKKLTVSYDFSIMAEHCHPPRLFMELFAVICIETSHYVAFVKCGVGHEAPWCFFDSMADRKGEQNGYNIPEMVACPDVSKWLSDELECRTLHENAPLDRYLPEHARRLLCDAYICMYQSPDVMMYR